MPASPQASSAAARKLSPLHLAIPHSGSPALLLPSCAQPPTEIDALLRALAHKRQEHSVGVPAYQRETLPPASQTRAALLQLRRFAHTREPGSTWRFYRRAAGQAPSSAREFLRSCVQVADKQCPGRCVPVQLPVQDGQLSRSRQAQYSDHYWITQPLRIDSQYRPASDWWMAPVLGPCTKEPAMQRAANQQAAAFSEDKQTWRFGINMLPDPSREHFVDAFAGPTISVH